MKAATVQLDFMDNANEILHPKKYFSHLYQGSIPEVYSTLPPTRPHELVTRTEGLCKTKSSLGFRYGLSVGQLIERINKKVEVNELCISIRENGIRPTSPPPIESLSTSVTDIKSLLSIENEDVYKFECQVKEADSTIALSETSLKKERRWALGTQNPCQVCGDKAAGFYCGAFVCEACKKFFMRASRQQKMKYTCLKDKNCKITKESRVQCQYCRFQKCLSFNMSIPGQKESIDRKENGISNIPCQVCSASSSGFHFGAITCEGCKGFFRRIAKENGRKQFHCSKSRNCEVTSGTRNTCRACRYQKCLDIGMSVEASRIGRQPNSVKHAINLELQKGKSSDSAGVSDRKVIDFKSLNNPDMDFFTSPPSVDADVEISGNDPEQTFTYKSVEITESTESNIGQSIRVKDEPEDSDVRWSKSSCVQVKSDGYDSSWFLSCEVNTSSKIEQFDRMKQNIEDIDTALQKVGSRDGYDEIFQQGFDCKTAVWKIINDLFTYNASQIVVALKMFPAFRILDLDDRIALVQDCLYSVGILNLSRRFNMETKDYCFFGCTKYEEKIILDCFPEFKAVSEDLLYVGNLLKTVAFDEVEITCLTGLLTFNADALSLKKRESVEEAQKNLMSFLEEYEEKKFNNWELRFGMLVLRIGELIGLNQRHITTMSKIFQSNPDLEISQLMKELYKYFK
ncbi:nuclear receptor ROR-alpha A-like [Saccostrea cucullata]|uniref:nuclear receptor ROR-alpha A-like n=1 Tax=Saccostrea cuccullata TaxID=36930 RepID=UPI002ED5AAE4